MSVSPVLQHETVRTSLEPSMTISKLSSKWLSKYSKFHFSTTSEPRLVRHDYAISTSIFDTGAISSPKHLQHFSVILPLHHCSAAKIPKGACNTAGSPSRSCLRKSPQLSRGLELYKCSKCANAVCIKCNEMLSDCMV